jgi:site-specific recombinase XerD
MKPEGAEFCTAISRYLNVYLPKLRGLSPNTVRSYRMALGQFVGYCLDTHGIPLGQMGFNVLEANVISGFLDNVEARGCSVSTRNQRLAAISAFARYVANANIAHAQVLAEIGKVPKKKAVVKPVGYLDQEALETLLRQPDASTDKGIRDLTILSMLYDTAARATEILTLKSSDLHINVKNPYVVLTGKGSKVRSVPLMERTVELIEVYSKIYHPVPEDPCESFIYTRIKGRCGQMSYESISKMTARYAAMGAKAYDAMPNPVRPHMIRHTRAMHLYQDGVPLSYIKDLLGHSNINTTSIYASASLEMLRDMVESSSRPLKTMEAVPDWKDEKAELMRLASL